MASLVNFFSYRYRVITWYIHEHPAFCLAVTTTFIIATVWIMNRTKKRPSPAIDLNKYAISKFGQLLEKTPDSVKWTVTRIMFFPSLLYNIFNYYTLPTGMHDWYNRIDKYLILGALPWHSTIPLLYKEGVRGVVNTCEEYEGPTSTYNQYSIKQLHIGITDFTSPTSQQIDQAIAFIEKYVDRGESVYLHCKAGKGRSTTIAVCYLMKAHNISAQQALKMIIQCRPQVSKYVWRRPCVIEFARRHNIDTEADKES